MDDGFYYNEAKFAADNILKEICFTYQIKASNVYWYHFARLLKEKYQVRIEPHIFKNQNLNRRFAGVCELGTFPLIQFNNSIFQTEERRHFTIIHEGIHFFRHKDDFDGEGEVFSDIIDHACYSPEEQKEELITNEAASIVMFNDVALKECMNNNWQFGKIASSYGISSSALFFRLVNYLRFNLNVNEKAARYLVGRFRYGSTSEARSFLPILINNFEAFEDWSNQKPLTGQKLDELYLQLGVGSNAPASHWYQLQQLFDFFA